MPTFPIASAADFSSPIFLTKEDERHLVKVVRVRAGETVVLTNNQGLLTTATVTSVKPLTFAVGPIRAGEKPAPITVCVPLIEKRRLELCLEKLTELNVKTAQLVDYERCQTHALTQNAFAKLVQTAREAQKQCGRAYPLEILPVKKISEMSFPDPQNTFYASPQADAATVLPKQSALPQTLLIGPEGGFSPSEENLFAKLHLQKIHLGQTILRSETACWVAVTLLKF